tara:strand:+ start:334 stop:1368 length:1035 start_codon:yes stop_codon:yes gene_type:complete
MNIGSIKNKKILYISVKTFNYEVEIANKLRELGAIVDYFDERPSNTVLMKAIIRVKRSLYRKKIDRYYRNILKKIKFKKYDYFFLVKGEAIPSFFLKKLKLLQKDCVFIFYTWDSFENNSNALSILHFFDRKLTFDNLDAENFNIEFRPLFYIDKYRKINYLKKPKYKVLFLGTAHSDRYRISDFIKNWCMDHKFSSFMYYYMESKIVYFLKSKFDNTYMGVKDFDYKKLTFKSLSIDEIIKYYEDSSIILDINLPNQRGLTMRTFEALGAGKKIITTNKEIKKYSFYNSNNIFVIDRENIQLERVFFESNFKPINEDMLFNMSISGWINSIFIQNDSSYWLNK